MVTMEERVRFLEMEVSGLKSLLGLSAPGRDDWQATVGTFRDDPLFEEAMTLGRAYREQESRADEGS